jgi:hypothetical protein
VPLGLRQEPLAEEMQVVHQKLADGETSIPGCAWQGD